MIRKYLAILFIAPPSAIVWLLTKDMPNWLWVYAKFIGKVFGVKIYKKGECESCSLR